LRPFLLRSLELMKTIIALFCLLTLTHQSRALDDNQMAQLLVGSWQSVAEMPHPNGTAHYVFDFTYNQNGQYYGTIGMTFPAVPGQATSGTVAIAGVWQIENGNLSCRVTQVYPAGFAAMFPSSSGAIQFIDRNTWKFVGDTKVARRTQ
jgi:hypothetical protein